MIHLNNISKQFWTPAGPKIILKETDMIFPSGVSVGLLGRNGAGKSTLMDMIGGTMKPDAGTIDVTGTVSWPVGFKGSFHRELTGAQNTRFIARVYGADTDSLLEYVKDFAELGSHLYLPVRSYSSGMRARLAFGVSIGIPFDTYLVDEVTAVGDAAFKRRCRLAFMERMENAGAVVVTHSMRQLRKLCEAGAVLEDGVLTYYDDINEAIAVHHDNMGSDEDE
ncbi:MAG: capsular polysaccharide transport system ATP-binding protein [Candidatus Azotimanducaceae bacterium]|jgi:capsular polysaccharide transport system ATP-binding protein